MTFIRAFYEGLCKKAKEDPVDIAVMVTLLFFTTTTFGLVVVGLVLATK